MIPLFGRSPSVSLQAPLTRSPWIVVNAATAAPQRQRSAYLLADDETPPEGFPLYLSSAPTDSVAAGSIIQLPTQLSYVAAGDILSISPDGHQIKTMWRCNGSHNSVLLTERCDNFCLMCSQPPKRGIDDWLLDEAMELIRLLPPHTPGILFTGGEPTIYGTRFLELLRLCNALLPEAQVHTLSNGRRFHDPAFAHQYAAIGNPRMMIGIPIYAAEPTRHDYVVQAEGAFNETIRGILNLATLEQRVEIRVVLHKQTAPVLIEIAEYILRNLPFVEQVALMGLEITGFTRANLSDLWIDPIDYAAELAEASTLLNVGGVKTHIYNHQLCLIPPEIWPYAVKSISDWKNEYFPACEGCDVRSECGGFFSSASHRHSDHIHPIKHTLTTT